MCRSANHTINVLGLKTFGIQELILVLSLGLAFPLGYIWPPSLVGVLDSASPN